MVTMLEFGLVFSFGAVFVALLDTFHRDRSTTATVQSLLVGVTLSFGVVSGTLITALGLPLVTFLSSILVPLGFFASFFAPSIEYLYMSIGLVSGSGISLGYFSAIVVVGRVFSGRQKVLCLAIQTACNALAGVIYPYFLNWLLHLYGLKGTFLILSAILCNGVVFCILCSLNKDSISDVNLRASESQSAIIDTDTNTRTNAVKVARLSVLNGFRHLKHLVNKPYIFMLVAQLVALTGLNGYIGLILDISRWKGFNDTQGLASFVFYNISNVISRLMPGVLKQMKGINSFVFPIISCLCGCTGQLLIYFGTNYAMYAVGTFLIGAAMGGNISAVVVLVVQVIRPEQVPVGTGLLFTVTGISSATIGSIFGTIRDTTGSYGSVVLMVGVMQVLGTIFYLMALLSRRRPKSEISATNNQENSKIFTVTVTKL